MKKKLDLNEARLLISDILNLNNTYNTSFNKLKNYSHQYQTNLFLEKNNFNQIFKFINNITDSNASKILIEEILLTDKQSIAIYFKSILNKNITPRKELANALNTLITDFDLLYDLIFNYFGPQEQIDIWREHWRKNRQYIYDYDNNDCYQPKPFAKKSIKDTVFACFESRIKDIFDLYGEKIFKKARRGPKLMFTFFLMFQEYFTDEMFNVLIDRIRVYNDKVFFRYVLTAHRRFPQQFQERLRACQTLMHIQNN